MQFPEKVFVELEIENKKYRNIENFKLSLAKTCLLAPISLFDKPSGNLTVTYIENLPFIEFYEQKLINTFGNRISRITERIISLQRLVKEKEKSEESDRLKSAFLANMSHEIRTPMNGILGFANLLLEPQLSDEQKQNYIQIIEKSGARMLNIINDIVNISKIESGIIDIYLSETNINNQLQIVYDSLKLDADIKKTNLSFHCALTEKEAIITFRSKFSPFKCCTSLLLASRRVSPLNRLLPASRKSLLHL